MAYEKLTDLAKMFPTLQEADGVSPFDGEALDRWACNPSRGSGAFHAAQFVLAVFNMEAPWECGRFDLMKAMTTWDAEHREAFLTWARNPWNA